MKKRRLPSLRRHGPVDEGAVGFEDLPPDERGSEVVTHPAPGTPVEGGAADDDTKPRPSMPASAVVLHGAADADAHGGPDRDEESDYLFRPPADMDDPDVDASAEDAEDGGLTPAVPDVVLDEDIRADVLAATGESTFVEGPPGSGISTLLAERIVTTLHTGAVTGDSLTVVTRDRGSAARLRERLRDLFEAAAADADDDVVRRRMGAAVGHLRGAHVGPGPEIAAAILRRWPEAAAIAPGFTVLAPHVARLRFERDFDAWLGGAGGDDPAVARALALGISPGQIRDLAEAVTVHIGLAPVTAGSAGREPDPQVVFADIAARIEALGGLAGHGDAEDAGVVQIRRLQAWLADTSGLDGHATIGHFLLNAPTKIRQAGSRAHWEPPATCAAQMEGCRDLAVVWAETRRAFGRSTLSALLDSIAAFADAAAVDRTRSGELFPTDVVPAAVSLLVRDAAVRRIERDRHRLVVVDDVWDVDAESLGLVLVLTSLDDDVDDPYRLRPGPGRLLAGGAAITSLSRSLGADPRLVTRLRGRGMTPMRLRTSFRAAPPLLAWTTSAFGALIGDDGDVALAPHPAVPAPQPAPATDVDGDGPRDDFGAGGDDAGAQELEEPAGQADDAVGPVPEPGPTPAGLADPNAAVSTNELLLPEVERPAATVLTPEGHAVTLPVGDEGPAEQAEGPEASGPEGSGPGPDDPLERAAAAAAVAAVPAPDDWGPVVAAWTRARGDEVVDLRDAEACAVAGSLRMLVDSDAPVVRLPDGTARPARWSDCVVVLGSAAGLEQYLDALESAGVPYARASTRTELLRRQEVADLLNALRAADDPDDTVSVVAALRGLAFGCSDTDLVVATAAAGAPLRPTPEPPNGTPERVADGLRTLASWHTRRDLPALELIDLALEATCLRQSARAAVGADPTHFEAVRALVVDWCGDSSPVRSFLAAVDAAFRPWTPTATTTPLPPAGADVVEVLTAAEAAGREHPVVAVANLHRLRVPMPVAVADHSAGRLHLRAGPPDRGFVTEGFDAALARDDEEYLAQRTRLVCTAFSRARDKLIVAVTATADGVDPDGEVPRRDLDRRVARLLVEPDPGADGMVRAMAGVTLLPVVPGQSARPEGGAGTIEDEEAIVEAPFAAGSTLADVTAGTDPLREAIALALSRVDFASTDAAPPSADADVAHLLDSVLGSDLADRARAADRVLRRPTVLLDGGPVGVFADRLDLVLVEGSDAVGVAVTIGPPDDTARTRVALGTHALGQAAGLGVGAALLVDARSGTVTVMGPADVAAAVGTALTPD